MSGVESARQPPLFLTDGWRAAVADDELALEFHEPDLDDSTWSPVAVPSTWQTQPGFADTDGPVLYRCGVPRIDLGDDERAWLVLGGVFSEADVWFDGHYLGDVEGYFAEHSLELDPNLLDAAEHTLALEVRHRPSSDPDGKHALVGTYDDHRVVDPTRNPGGLWRILAHEIWVVV